MIRVFFSVRRCVNSVSCIWLELATGSKGFDLRPDATQPVALRQLLLLLDFPEMTPDSAGSP